MTWVVAILFGIGLQVGAETFKNDPVLSKLVGNWTAEGELTGADGEKISITETWTGKIDDSGSLVMTGTRMMNEEEQEFSWTFSFNSTSEIFECEYSHTGMEEPLRFDVTISVTERTTTLKAPFGDGGSLSVLNTIAEDGKSMEGDVTIFDAQGQKQIHGTVKHKKETTS